MAMAELRDFELVAAREWLERLRGSMSQELLAEDITRTTGWTITRDRYSKYESGSLPFGRQVLGHFVAYWTSKNKPGPDLTPPAPVLDPMERIAAAVESIARNLELLRTDMAGQSGATIGAVQHLGAQLTATLEGMRAER